MVKRKRKFMAYLATVFLLIVSMLPDCMWWPWDAKTAQTGKSIEITDVTGQKLR